MADNKIGDGLKKILLAGVGAVAITAEKGSEIIGELVKKGELTVEQGKELNKDLQRNFKDSMDKKGINIDEISQKISKMSEEELAKIKEQIEAVEKLIKENPREIARFISKLAMRDALPQLSCWELMDKSEREING